jgi:hypothetical protein
MQQTERGKKDKLLTCLKKEIKQEFKLRSELHQTKMDAPP